MTNIDRYRVSWTGFSGAPGVSTFYLASDSAVVLNPLLSTFFNAVKPYVPAAVTFGFPTVVDTLNDVDGSLVTTRAITGVASIAGTGGGNWAAPAGIMVRWVTGVVVDKHRLIGKTYLVPTSSSALDTDGTVSSAALTAIGNAATALVAGATFGLRVWHRPRKATVTRPARVGSSQPILAATIMDRISVLRSRRD